MNLQNLSAPSPASTANLSQLSHSFQPNPVDISALDPTVGCISRHFEESVRKTPDAIALACGNVRLTYRELNAKANRLAGYLIKAGVKNEDLVALFLDRTERVVIAILAVLKAGGAYVPIDSSYPPERAGFMIEDTGTSFVLTESDLESKLPKFKGRTIVLDKIDTNDQSAENPNVEIDPSQVAYVIYTSGSTGKPKGVLVTHHNVVRLFQSTDHWFHFNESDVWTFFHSYAFDFSVWEIWGALLYGGRLVVVPFMISRSPSSFLDLLRVEKVTVLNQTPSAFRQLIWAEGNNSETKPLHLRYVIFGGEALELQSLKPWFDRHGDEKPVLVNMYGITETTVHVTYRPISRADVEAGRGSVIGEPIPDLEIYLLNEKLEPVGPMEPGEIVVGGAGVAKGYLNRPDLNEQRFIANPFAGHGSSGRLYRSGDLARLLPDGDLEYLGRMDHQVKIRGFRIELGEIETALNRMERVRECVVIAEETALGDKRLVAYFVPNGKTPANSELRAALQTRLPEYMIPAVFVDLEAIPLTSNGKVDRRALPSPDRLRPEMSREYKAPQTEQEQALARIWSEALEVDRVGVEDNFFELGGDSIRSIQVLSRAQKSGIHFSLQQLFQNPTISGLTKGLAVNGVHKGMAALEAFGLLKPADRAKLPQGLEDAYPVVMLQEGMLFHSELNPDSAVFHDIFSFKISAPFDESNLKQALSQLGERHSILRTSFNLSTFSQPLQLVHKKVEIPLTSEDLREFGTEAREQSLVAWIEAEKRRPFDWTVPPLLKCHAQIAGESFQFIVSFHHAILDGWSLAAMLTEIFQDYFALTKGTGRRLPAPDVLYREFVALELEALKSKESRDFWVEKLKDSTVSTLPRWPKELRKGGEEQVRGPEIPIPQKTFEGLKELAQSTGVPLRTVLLAAHHRVLNLLSHHTDVVSGLISNGRPEKLDGERMIGLFLNTVPVRLQLTGGTWRELVQQTFKAERELIPHRRYPLAQIQNETGGQALFETAFDFVHFHVYRNLENYDGMAFLEGHYFEANNFTLLTTFMLDVNSTNLQMHFDYDPNELCPEQIALMCEYYVNTLAEMARRPDGRYENFSPLSESERNRLLRDWNNTATADRNDFCLHELFEEQANRQPQAIAIVAGKVELTYRELNRRANQLAHHLKNIGVGSGSHVVVYMSRRAEMIVALLGILKAGGTYVPLETTFPAARVEWVMKSLGVSCIVTESAQIGRVVALQLPELRHVISVDKESAPHSHSVLKISDTTALTQCADVNPPLAAAPDDRAYIIFTSGSTGTPKGVVLQHRPVINLIQWVNKTFAVGPKDRVLFVTSLCFDLSVYDVFGLLGAGGSIRVASDAEVRDPERLANILVTEPITFWDSAPAALQQIAPLFPGLETKNGKLRLVFLSGDWIPVKLPDEVRAAFPRAKVIALGGATEAAIWSNFYPVEKVDPEWPSIPYGKPIQNARYHILDARLNPCPIGVPGDLYIGGNCLAWGYANDPELTAEKFIPDPFSGEREDRLYRTGDLARYLPDGNIEFLGRADFQVKIRGYRIELGEIETVLRQHPAVNDAIVLAREDVPGDKKLVAYIRTSDPSAVSAEEIRDFVKLKVPDYMVPSAFLTLREFPVTANGKLDRKALPPPDRELLASGGDFAAPRNSVEKVLAEVWSEALGLERIGIHDDFIEMGGHSLLAVQLISRLRDSFLSEIPLRTLFKAPTVARFAQEILSDPIQRPKIERTADMLVEVSRLSDDDIDVLLAKPGETR